MHGTVLRAVAEQLHGAWPGVSGAGGGLPTFAGGGGGGVLCVCVVCVVCVCVCVCVCLFFSFLLFLHVFPT